MAKAKTGADRPPEGGDGDEFDSKEAGAEVTDAIAKQLRTLYDAVVNEPVPEHLLDLMARLQKSGRDPE